MDSYDKFYSFMDEVAKKFRQVPRGETIKIVSHLDADGLSSCSILVHAMKREGRDYSVSVVQKLDDELAKQLALEPYKTILISDLGSGQFSILKSLTEKKIFIFDHHKPEIIEEIENIIHSNPHLFGIDGSKEVSGAGIAYLFAKALDQRNVDIAHVAIVGAIGDVQENSGFEKVNTDILNDAVKAGNIKIIPGIKAFGAQTKHLHKLLAYSTEHTIPGVSGSESTAIQFLQQIGINPKDGEKWKTLVDLEDHELQNLVAGIIMRRLSEKSPEAIIGPIYILPKEDKNSPFRDAKEFSTLLNACGRMDKPELGIGACLGEKETKQKAILHLADYKKQLMKYLNWFEEGMTSGKIIRGNNYMIINAREEVMHTMIGTLASIVSKSYDLSEGTLILSMAKMDPENTKVSLRICSSGNDHDMREVISEIAEKVGGSFGGHSGAAGAIIKTEREEEFIQEAKIAFERRIQG